MDRFLHGPEQHGEIGVFYFYFILYLRYFIVSILFIISTGFFFTGFWVRVSNLFFPLVLRESPLSVPFRLCPLSPLAPLTGFCRGGLEDFVWWTTLGRLLARANERTRTDGGRVCRVSALESALFLCVVGTRVPLLGFWGL